MCSILGVLQSSILGILVCNIISDLGGLPVYPQNKLLKTNPKLVTVRLIQDTDPLS